MLYQSSYSIIFQDRDVCGVDGNLTNQLSIMLAATTTCDPPGATSCVQGLSQEVTRCGFFYPEDAVARAVASPSPASLASGGMTATSASTTSTSILMVPTARGVGRTVTEIVTPTHGPLPATGERPLDAVSGAGTFGGLAAAGLAAAAVAAVAGV
ncbi:hypothetical protein HKX48_000341 [Thoreauomyces humboldtii]|nr:hypothetical protein HKX48_000341 [Thoreauomyces humboldtii]